MRLIVHAGIHRTGTTSLQKCLERNRAVLAARGVHYPPTEGGRHRSLLKALRDPAAGSDAIAVLADGVPDGTHTVIVSNEDFCQLKNVSWIDAARAHFDVEAVIYLARQDRWVMSWYNQHVKSAWNVPLARMRPDEFLNEIDRFHWLDYASLADLWAGRLGDDALHLRVLEADQVTDVMADFLELTLGDTDGLDLRRPRLNRSLPGPVLEFTRLLNEMGFPKKRRPLLLRALAQPSDSYGTALPIYAPATRNDIIARFAASNGRVAAERLGRPDGRLFIDAHVADDTPFEEPHLPPSEEFAQNIVGPFLRDALSEI